MNFLKRIWGVLRSIITSPKADAIARKINDLVPVVLPIVKTIAQLTPTRADDEIVALCEKYSLPVLGFYLATPVEERGGVLLNIAAKIAKKFAPDSADHIIDSAVQFAVSLGVKGE
jgi:hypothetical protein